MSRKRFLGNAAILIATEVLVKVLGIVITVLIARFLGVEQFGLLAFAYATSEMFLIVFDFGFDRMAVRDVARKPQRASRFLVNISVIKGGLYLPAALCCMLFVSLRGQDHGSLFVIMLAFLAVAAQRHMWFICSLFRAGQIMMREGQVRFVFASCSFMLSVVLLLLHFGLKEILFARLAALTLSIGLALYFAKRDLGLRWVRPDKRYARRLLVRGIPFALMVICINLNMFLPTVALGMFQGDAAAGIYAAGLKLVEPFGILPEAMSWAILPALSLAWGRSEAEFSTTLHDGLRYLSLLSLPLAVGILFVGRDAVVLIFGQEYLKSAAVLSLLALSLVPDYMNSLFSSMLMSMNRERTALRVSAAGAACTLIACVGLIPAFGPAGAAAACLISESLMFVVLVRLLHKSLRLGPLLACMGRIAVATAVMAGALVLMDSLGWNLFVRVPLAMAVYAAALVFVVREVSTHEVRTGIDMLASRLPGKLRRSEP